MNNIRDKLIIANAKVSDVYNVGESKAYNKPYIDTSKITNFHLFCEDDRISPENLDTSNGTSFSYMFQGSKLTTIPLLNTSKGTIFYCMFNICKKLKKIPQIDLSKGTDFYGMFQACDVLAYLPKLETYNGTKFTYMFYNCKSLTTIEKINISKATNVADMFYGCTKLQNITFDGSINRSISFSYSSKLTTDSIQSIINALCVYSGSSQPTLTLNSASWTAIEAITPPDGYSTWKEYISNYKNWKYA